LKPCVRRQPPRTNPQSEQKEPRKANGLWPTHDSALYFDALFTAKGFWAVDALRRWRKILIFPTRSAQRKFEPKGAPFMFSFRNIVSAVAAGLLAVLAPAAQAQHTVKLGNRSYVVHLPSYAVDAPILLGIHGVGQTPQSFESSTQLGARGKAAGYIVVLPQGTDSTGLGEYTWNAGYCCGTAMSNQINDVAFLDTVIADVRNRFTANSNAVYVAGMSNGAMMAGTYAAARAGQVRAVASVAGTPDPATLPGNGQPVPFLHIHGTLDGVVPMQGGVGRNTKYGTSYQPLQVSLDIAKAKFGTTFGRDRSRPGVKATEGFTWAAHAYAYRTVFVQGGKHVWFGSPGGAAMGSMESGVDATSEILWFFSNFTPPAPPFRREIERPDP
jgi:polyhydroxybutyrate depolymerase